MTMLQTYEQIKDCLIVRCVPTGDDKLKDAAHFRVGDFEMVLYVMTGESGLNVSWRLSKKTLEKAGLSVVDVIKQVLARMSIEEPPRLYISPEMIRDPSFETGAFMDTDYPHIPDECIPLLTTVQETRGAVALFYPGVQKRISHLVGGDYYVIFTSPDISIHEARIFPAGLISLNDIIDLLLKNNELYNDLGETLSKCVYRYMCESDQLLTVAQYEETKIWPCED